MSQAQGELPSGLVLSTHSGIARHIAAAAREVMLAVPTLRSQVIAEALREAMVVRGVEVYLLVSPEHAEARAAYVTSLSLAGARVRLAPVEGGYLVVDRQRTITGALIGTRGGMLTDGGTVLHKDSSYTRQVVSWFYRTFRQADVYEPTFPLPPGRGSP